MILEIKNGFVRSSDGDWFSMDRINIIRVVRMFINDDYDEDCFKIIGVCIDNGESCSITLNDYFSTDKGAQEALDEMMNR